MEDWEEVSVYNVLSHRIIGTGVPKFHTQVKDRQDEKPMCNPRAQELETGDSTEKGDYLN